ncbi:MAG: hypothetical protein M9904_14620 [Chitinophagaceae bacterium]|nr:hypothetical protein [Chitinophagaceae bacterium]
MILRLPQRRPPTLRLFTGRHCGELPLCEEGNAQATGQLSHNSSATDLRQDVGFASDIISFMVSI